LLGWLWQSAILNNRKIKKLWLEKDMKMAWQPQEDGLRQILELLKESQSSDNAVQRLVQQVSFKKYGFLKAVPCHNIFKILCALTL